MVWQDDVSQKLSMACKIAKTQWVWLTGLVRGFSVYISNIFPDSGDVAGLGPYTAKTMKLESSELAAYWNSQGMFTKCPKPVISDPPGQPL